MKVIGKILLFSAFFSCQSPSSEFVKIPEGRYQLGQEGHYNNPSHQVNQKAFWIRSTEVTNSDFAAFVNATNYRSTAEVLKNAMVFRVGLDEFEWLEDSTAYWRYPFGRSAGGIDGKENHPVSCISYIDALAYCEWKGERLPSLDEWEIASRANSIETFFFDTSKDSVQQYGNIWINHKHDQIPLQDKHLFTAPVAQYKPNPWGLYDMYGNVFEFCADKTKNTSSHMVNARGGSWWCSHYACNYFNSVDIGQVHRNASFSNHGFRTVKD